MTNSAAHHRQLLWQQLQEDANQDTHWDMIIVGGGITGVGILREAARRGLKALLLEQQDFAWGTSSRSSKMVHGGLRYLGMGDITLTRHSLQERERMLSEAPGLVERMGYYFTLRKQSHPPRWAVKILLWLYDRIAGIRNHHPAQDQELAQVFPGMDQRHLRGAYYYTDAVTDDARLVLRVLQEAQSAGGTALNYARVNQLLQDKHGKLIGVAVEDVQHGTRVNVHASVIINATGAWADRLRNQVNPEVRIRPLRGSHIVVAAEKLPVSHAITLMHPQDNRGVFIFPWLGRTVIGTTDLDHTENLDTEASITAAEIDYLLQATASLFPYLTFEPQDIISTWAGVRPVISSDKHAAKNALTSSNASSKKTSKAPSKAPSKERRDHAVWTDNNLITVSGGKLTTFRLIALDVLKAAQAFLPEYLTPRCHRVFTRPSLTPAMLLPNQPELSQRLIDLYGDQAADIIGAAQSGELAPIADTDITLAECRWALKTEQVIHLDDLLLRRTRLGLLLKRGATDVLPKIKILCQQELRWDESHWDNEVRRYQQLWSKHYAYPSTKASTKVSTQTAASESPLETPNA